MKRKTDEPFIPDDVKQAIFDLHALLEQAAALCEDILLWYTRELKSYDSCAEPDMELFDPGTGVSVEGISSLAIMESLSELQTANECWNEGH